MFLFLQRWLILLLLSSVLSGVLHALHAPAGVLVGCMVAGIWMGHRGIAPQPSQTGFTLAQGLVGCLIAHSLQLSMLKRLAGDWPFFLLITLSILAASSALGWLLMRLRILPGTTAVWGLAPGAASAMVAMSEEFGADVRLVAFMQYLRVVIVTALASLIAHIGNHVASVPRPELDWWAWGDPWNVGVTLGLVGVGVSVARWLRIPGGAMLLPMGTSIALQSAGFFQLDLPPVIMGLAYAMLGWSIGLRFNKASLLYAWKVLPVVLAAIFALIGVGMLHAAALFYLAGFDPLTAYLSTSPGGADSVAVIAATSAVDAGFVMAMQMARFVMVLVAGPLSSRWVARGFGHSA